jgi:hypothetical protein
LDAWLKREEEKDIAEGVAADQEIINKGTRDNAVALARQAIKSSGHGYTDLTNNSGYQGALKAF